jgi:uncharacterized protein
MKPKIFFHESARFLRFSTGGCDGDCACSLPLTHEDKPSQVETQKQDLISGSVRINGQVSSLPLCDDFWAVMAPQSEPGWAVVNESALTILDFFQTSHSISDWDATKTISSTDFRDAVSLFYNAGFLTSEYSQSNLETKTQHLLESWLFLTRACNMACAHCFVSKDSREMSLETGLQAVEKLFELAQKNGHPGVKIKYAGGEPTLRWDLMTKLHAHAVTVSQASGVPLSDVIVTNGAALSKARLEYLKNSNIQIAISLDDFGEGHDRQRAFVNGLPSFERVYKNILLALDLGIRPYLTITLTRLNLDELPAITEFALKNNLFLNWNFYRPQTPNDPLIAEFQDLHTALLKSLEIVRNYAPAYPFIDKLIDRSNFSTAHKHTCGAGRHYLSIDCDGSVLPCHMLSGSSQQSIPINSLSSSQFSDFENEPIDQKEGCNTCQWQYWCTGGCPILSRNARPLYCEVYKEVYPALFQLMGAQVISSIK